MRPAAQSARLQLKQMLLRFRFLALPLYAGLAAAQTKPVTLDVAAAQSSPRSVAIVWAPDGARFAYSEAGSIRIYDVASGGRRELVKLADLEQKAVKGLPAEAFGWQNRRVRERQFQWSDSGEEMLVLAGGDLFLVRVATGAWQQLTATAERESDPKLAPGGRLLSFRRGHDLYAMEIASRKITRLTRDGSATLLNGELDWVYPEELDLGTAHWWSPDGARIAFLQLDVSREPVFPQVDLLRIPAVLEPQRFPQPGMPNAEVRLGVVRAAGGPVRWMDLGAAGDQLLARVFWSPRGVLAAERLNRIQNRLDLDFIDPDTGKAKAVIEERDPYWVNVNDVFRFLDGGARFLWGSERDGFLHLYLYSADGKLERQITRGEWEVSGVAGVEGNDIYYTSTEPSPLERQFYRIGLNGRGKRRLTAAAGTHSISMAPNCRYYLDTASSLTTPPSRTIHARDGARVAEFRAAPPQSYELLPTEIVRMKAADGTQLYARLIRPKGFDAGRKYPAVVMVYGGPHAQAVRDAWAGPNWDQALAQRGFVIWQLDNRGSAGRGHAFESKVFRNLGAVELEDQKRGLEHLLSLGFVDPRRVGIYGWSYGGFMTLYSLANAPGLFRAGIAGAPVTDWRNYDTIYTERYMGLPANNPEGYRRSAPVGKAENITAHLLLVHNYQDDNVHFQNTMQMANALERAGRRFEMAVYPQKAHGVTGGVRRQMLKTLTSFFERTLKQ